MHHPKLYNWVIVCYIQTQCHKVPLIVVKGSDLTLMGRIWLQVFNLHWYEIFVLQTTAGSPVQPILQKHPDEFQEGLGTLMGCIAKIIVDPAAPPRYFKSPTVLYFFLHDKIETELNHLVTESTLEPVETAKWAALIVAVLKPDKTIVCICGDF